jgi:histone H3/H4
MSESGETGEKKDTGLLIVQSKVREVIRQKEKRVSDEFIGALSEHVLHTIEKAVQRCTANGRSTLRPEDI